MRDDIHPIEGYDPSLMAREAVAQACEEFGLAKSAWYIRDTQHVRIPATVAMRAIDILNGGK